MRYIVTVRGTLRDGQTAQALHDEIVRAVSPTGRSLGSTAHTAYLNLQDRRQFLAVDQWASLEGLQKFMGDPAVPAQLGKMFDGQPEVTVWAEAGWEGY